MKFNTLLNIPSGDLPRTPLGSTLPETGISPEKLSVNFQNENRQIDQKGRS